MFKKIRTLLRMIISNSSQESSKRFITVALSLSFILAYFVSMILLVLIVTAKSLINVPATTISLFFTWLNTMTNNVFYIICFGVGAIAVTSATSFIANVFQKNAEAKLESAKRGSPNTVVQNKNVAQQTVNE
jgi:uncharacterized protein involved in cysteine biosynthesis